MIRKFNDIIFCNFNATLITPHLLHLNIWRMGAHGQSINSNQPLASIRDIFISFLLFFSQFHYEKTKIIQNIHLRISKCYVFLLPPQS